MAGILKLKSRSERITVTVFVSLTCLLWFLTIKWLTFGQFIERPTPIAFLTGCLTAFFTRYFFRKGQAYAILDPSGDGKARVEAGKMSEKKILSCNGLKDVTEIHVYHQIVSSTASYYPCLLFKDGFELWLPEGIHISELVVKWFRDNLGMDLEVITHMNADTKKLLQEEEHERCHVQIF